MMKFSLKKRKEPVEIEGDDGVVRVYSLQEMNGKDRDEYLNSMKDRFAFEGGKPSQILNIVGLQAGLVCRCLFDDKGTAVNLATIQSFPSTALVELFKVAQRINGLTEEGVVEAKNG